MASTPVPELEVKCLTSTVNVLARVKIIPVKIKDGSASLFAVSSEEARSFCEEPQQLCERGRYEYILTAESELHLSSEFALRPRAAVKPSGLGSPVLQRKAGYRERLRVWLQFHAEAQLEWKSGAEIFRAGARNMATLYEYWLFFQLEELFRQRFKCDQPLHAVVVDKTKAPPQLVLQRGVELKTPVSGVWSQTAGRDLRAEFHFNRKFTPRSARDKAGSWTRGVQPDYTISVWPAKYSKQEAEQNELMVHVHFDSKYRVERLSELVGNEADDNAFNQEIEQKEEARTAAKYADLLKMHAYRDAVRRTAGAYVLYPGKPGDGQKFEGFHEVLPGLGAFAIRPDKNGKPEGINALAVFLDRVIEHLANRTTARERVSYHLSEAYELKEEPVPYGSLVLPESDVFGADYRALPPAEHQVVVAWYDSPKQLEWT